MTNKLISRKAVLDHLNDICNRCGRFNRNNGAECGYCELCGMDEFVEELPTIPQTDISSIIERLRKAEEVFRKNGEQASLEANGIHYAIEVIEQFTPQTAIKHFGAMECPNCGALFYEVPMIETVLEEIKEEVNQYGSICVAYTIKGNTESDIEKVIEDVLKQAKRQFIDLLDKRISREE